jgi:probable F420-dependent oxidoreductase
MDIGISFPRPLDQAPDDPAAVRDFAQAVEGMGYRFIGAGEHILGADIANRPGWKGPYTQHDAWHDPFAFFGFLAACTNSVILHTSVLVLPLRQTALVAKQAAEVDILSRGRMRLAIGVGWNTVEFEALNEDFRTRGKRTEEQIEVLRALWTQEVVTYHGRWHHISEAGLNPLPVQRPIPIWMGGSADAVMQRVARLGDGWTPELQLDAIGPALERFRGFLAEAGRDPASVAVAARMRLAPGDPESWARDYRAWQELGITDLQALTQTAGYTSLDQHQMLLRRFMDTVKEVSGSSR